MDRAKILTEHYFNVRNKAKYLFIERDPLSESAQLAMETTYMVTIPQLTEKNYKIILFGLSDTDPEKVCCIFSICI